MTLTQSALMIPALVLSAAFARTTTIPASSSNSLEKNLASPGELTPSAGPHRPSPAEFVLQRKERIQRVLITLDRIAQITQQMKPENAERIEPVIVDLAEQTIDLANERALMSSETDATLTRLETTVGELVRMMNRYVEPEASL